MIESFYRATIAQSITTTDTVSSINTAGGLRVSLTPSGTYSAGDPGYVTISPNTENEEIFEFSGYDDTLNVLTLTKRGIKPTSSVLTTDTVDYNNPSYIKSHSLNDSCRGDVNHINIGGKVSKAGDTMTGPLKFSGTTNSGIKLSNLTTTQRDALTPEAGMKIYNTTDGVAQTYSGGTWIDEGTGSFPNASLTVAGKVEIATQGEVDGGTDTGGTGAIVTVVPSTFNTGITNKLATNGEAIAGSDNTKLMTPLRVAEYCPSASTSAQGKVELATDAEALAGTDETRYTNPYQLISSAFLTPTAGTDFILAKANTQRTNVDVSFVKVKEIEVKKAGTYTVSFEMGLYLGIGTGHGRIYVNGVAVGTAQTVTNTPFVAFPEDFTIAKGDLVQVYAYVAGADQVYIRNMNIKFNLVANPAIYSVTLD